jgi:eukaryotic-like serine/threonine-protein kinase
MISIRTGTIIAGKYRLEEPLARGGMGAIWIARHIQLDVLLAVKFIDPDFAATAEGRARFEREAKSAAMLHSPNVVQIHDYGVEFETPYLAMELLKGEDLSARLKREGRLSLEATAKIAIHVSKALRKAHEAGVIHRDLKPSNIFIVYAEEDEDEELVKVLDFGVAKLMTLGSADEDETKRGALIGSPRYMSPEQARRNREIDHRSDLWSLGVILFRAVTGQLPFPGDEVADVLVKICSEPLPIASQIAPDLGSEVDRFFAKALCRDPGQRFQSAREMALDFAALIGASTATSRFGFSMPGDGMRVSWAPGLLPFDYTPQAPGVAARGSTAGKTPFPGVQAARSRTPTLQPVVSPAQASVQMPPVSPPLASVTSPSPSPALTGDGMGPASFEPVSETIPMQSLDDAEMPGSAPTHVDATLIMADRRARETGRPRAEAHRRSDYPARGSHRASDAGDLSDETAKDGRRITPPTRVVDAAIDETRRSSVPSIPDASRRNSVQPAKAGRISEPSEGSARDSLPGVGPSATLTSSNGTVDIPPGRAAVRARRALALWLTLVAALMIVVGALAFLRLDGSSRAVASGGPANDAPSSGALGDPDAPIPPSLTSAAAVYPTASASLAPSLILAPSATPPLDRPSAPPASAPPASAPLPGKRVPVPEGER